MYNSLVLLQDKLAAQEAENKKLKKALGEIKDYAESQMGEWSCVQPPYLPAEMEVLYDIIEMCESGLTQDALDLPSAVVNHCKPVNGVHAPFCTGHETENQ